MRWTAPGSPLTSGMQEVPKGDRLELSPFAPCFGTIEPQERNFAPAGSLIVREFGKARALGGAAMSPKWIAVVLVVLVVSLIAL